MADYEVYLPELLDRFSDAIWENGKHKRHCESFILEINEITISKKSPCMTPG